MLVYRISWMASLVIFSLLISEDATATCMDLGCQVVVVDDSCDPTDENEYEEGPGPLLKVTCSYTCSTPGKAGGISSEPLQAENVDRIRITRVGCERPLRSRFVFLPDRCSGGSVVRLEDELPPGKYTIRAEGDSQLEITIKRREKDQGEKTAEAECPSELEYSTWRAEEMKEKERRRQEKLRLEQKQWQKEARERIEEEKRSCTSYWDEKANTCLPTKPAPHISKGSSRSIGDKFWDSGKWYQGRGKWGLEISIGASGTLFSEENQDGDYEYGGQVGGSLSAGFRLFRRFYDESMISDLLNVKSSPGMSWCAPVGCLGIGVFFMPGSSFLGNEFGVDLRGRLLDDIGDGSLSGEIGLRPALRVARNSRGRTASFVGAWVPEFGFYLPREQSNGFYLRFLPYPIDIRLGRYLALAWDGPGMGLMFPFHEGETKIHFSTGLSLSWLLLDN